MSPTESPYTPPQASETDRPRTSAMAVWSMVLGILGLCSCITAVPGLILGIVSLIKIDNPVNRLAGKGFAIAGIVLSGLSFIVAPFAASISMPAYTQGLNHARTTKSVSQSKQILMAMKMYAMNHDGDFPASLEVLTEDEEILMSPELLVSPNGEKPYVLLRTDAKDTMPVETPILLDPNESSGKVVVGYVGGHVRPEQVEDVLPLLEGLE